MTSFEKHESHTWFALFFTKTGWAWHFTIFCGTNCRISEPQNAKKQDQNKKKEFWGQAALTQNAMLSKGVQKGVMLTTIWTIFNRLSIWRCLFWQPLDGIKLSAWQLLTTSIWRLFDNLSFCVLYSCTMACGLPVLLSAHQVWWLHCYMGNNVILFPPSNLNSIEQSWSEIILPQKLNLIYLSLPKIIFSLSSGNCIATGW